MSNPPMKKIPARFYRTSTGNEPVKEWILGLGVEDRKIIGQDIARVEFGWPIGLPVCKALRGYSRLWEVRSNLIGGRIARVLFYVKNGEMILLNGFEKKTQKTPQNELILTEKRRRDHEKNN